MGIHPTIKGIMINNRIFNSKGLSFINGTSQDYAKHAALILYDKLAIIPKYLGEYIGIKESIQIFKFLKTWLQKKKEYI